MTWVQRGIMFAVCFTAAMFFSDLLTLAIFTACALLLLLLLYRYNKLPDPLTAVFDRIIYRKTTTTPRRTEASRSTSPKRQQAATTRRKTEQRRADPPPPHEPVHEVSDDNHDLFKLFNARRFIDSLRHKIVAQNPAIQSIAEALGTYFSKIQPARPLSILVVGYESSGKSELLKHLPVALGEAFPAQIRIIPEYHPITQGDSVDTSQIKPKHQSKRVLVHAFDDISRLTENGQRQLTNLLDDSEKAGLILVCSVAANTLSATSRAEITAALSQIFEPSLLARFEHIVNLQELEEKDKVCVLLIILHDIIRQYGVSLTNDRSSPIIELAEDAAQVWSKNGVDGIHLARQYLEKTVSGSLQTARAENWQTITVKYYNADSETITVSPST